MRLVRRLLKGFALLVGAFAVYLLTVALVPGLAVPAQPLRRSKADSEGADDNPDQPKLVVDIPVAGTALRGWLYLPAELSAPVPCVVMANGLGGTMAMGLESYAVRFREAGLAVLLFDYRYFGESGGEPRQLIWIPDQLADWAAAVAYVRSRPEIDPARIGLWGTSLSGGHVVVMAARDDGIACAVAQCPGLDGHVSAEMAFQRSGISHGLRMVVHGQRDLVRSWLGLSPHKVPIVGEPGSVALMTTPDAYEAFARLAPADFVNEACARITIRGDKYRPVTQAHKVHCPVLLQICEHDAFTPISAAEETAAKLGAYGQMLRYPIGHFDIYFGEHWERSVTDQLEFLRRHLAAQ